MKDRYKIRSLRLMLVFTFLLYGGFQKEGKVEPVDKHYHKLQLDFVDILITNDYKMLKTKPCFIDYSFEDIGIEFSFLDRHGNVIIQIIGIDNNSNLFSNMTSIYNTIICSTI